MDVSIVGVSAMSQIRTVVSAEPDARRMPAGEKASAMAVEEMKLALEAAHAEVEGITKEAKTRSELLLKEAELKAKDLMVDAPTPVSEAQLKELGIAVRHER